MRNCPRPNADGPTAARRRELLPGRRTGKPGRAATVFEPDGRNTPDSIRRPAQAGVDWSAGDNRRQAIASRALRRRDFNAIAPKPRPSNTADAGSGTAAAFPVTLTSSSPM